MQSEASRYKKSFEHSPKPSKHQKHKVFNDSNVESYTNRTNVETYFWPVLQYVKKYAEFNGDVRFAWNLLKLSVCYDFHVCHFSFERWFLLLYSTNQKEMTLAAPGKKVQVKLLGGKQTTAPWTFSPGGYSGILMALWPHDLLLFSKRNIWHWDQNSFAAVKWP